MDKKWTVLNKYWMIFKKCLMFFKLTNYSSVEWVELKDEEDREVKGGKKISITMKRHRLKWRGQKF